MSTPLLDPSRFANLRASLLRHSTDGFGDQFGGSCSSLNGELFRAVGLDPFGRSKPINHESKPDIPAAQDAYRSRIGSLVFDWQRANWAAHTARYSTPAEEWQAKDWPAQPSPKLPRGEVLSVPALLKALRALRYNCDGGNASGDTVKASLDVLDAIIDALKDHCLELLPEYAAAEWAI